MLTTDQKEAILRSAGVSVPDPPPGAVGASAREPHGERRRTAKDGKEAATPSREATRQWARTIETLFVEYAARRAAKSLRDAEEARQLTTLQRAAQ